METAGILFYNEGIAATGIDTIAKKAGVAKKSLYNNFSSKAELVTTYIRLRHEEWLALYDVQSATGNNARLSRSWRYLMLITTMLSLPMNGGWECRPAERSR
ncbi:TetR/AcrR family transcriptional regulator [Providencia stuartii]|uniref:TetR/AcrR family transcriptional regulator n=1 Tax=Providencia stuartii TaxID=588 RepID=UPI0034DD1C58